MTIKKPLLPLSSNSEKLVDAHVEILGSPEPEELAFLHAVLAQCSLPYREPPGGVRDYIRESGKVGLIVSSGFSVDPISKKPILQGIPYGAKPRLLMIHLCTEAVRRQSARVEVAGSMSAFMKDLGLRVSGGKNGSISMFKDQLNRLAAARLQLIMSFDDHASVMNPAPIIKQFDVWFPHDHRQRMLWPSEVTLSQEFFETLQKHALPIDPRSVKALQNSARALDTYTWLAHRLPRVNKKQGDRVSWQALQGQFGPDIHDLKNFKRDMVQALKLALAVYPRARVEQVDGGLLLKNSAPPIARKVFKGLPK
jgi:hypothetical protein